MFKGFPGSAYGQPRRPEAKATAAFKPKPLIEPVSILGYNSDESQLRNGRRTGPAPRLTPGARAKEAWGSGPPAMPTRSYLGSPPTS